MAYLGTQPAVGSFKRLDDISASFNDSTTTFNLTSGGESVVIQSPQTLLVSVDGVLQEPVSAYNATGSSIEFTEAPNTNATFFAIQLGDALSVGVPSDDTVGAAKLKDLAVTEGKIAAGSVTNAKLGANAVTQAKVAQNAIGRVQMADDAVASESLAPLTNLFEDASINASAFGANVNIDILDNSVVYSTAAADRNICVNFRGDGSTSLNDSMTTGNSITAAVLVTNTGTPYFVSNTQVDGVLVVPKVQGGSQLTGGNASSTDIYTITVLKTADATFTMFLSQTQFA